MRLLAPAVGPIHPAHRGVDVLDCGAGHDGRAADDAHIVRRHAVERAADRLHDRRGDLAAGRAAEAAGGQVILRVPDGSDSLLKRVLDRGFRSIIVPMVNSADEAAAIVGATATKARPLARIAPAFALLGGQELVEQWVLGMNLSKTEFLILSQVIIFILGWPLEWTEIIVIFMPIFIPLLDNFGVDPLFFGLLVALNLQTAFLSPPVAMSAFYLKGVAPKHVTLNQIFAGMLPFMGIQIIAIILLFLFCGNGNSCGCGNTNNNGCGCGNNGCGCGCN